MSQTKNEDDTDGILVNCLSNKEEECISYPGCGIPLNKNLFNEYHYYYYQLHIHNVNNYNHYFIYLFILQQDGEETAVMNEHPIIILY